MVVAYKAPLPEHFHLWRKRVKYLKHQMEILTPMWPEVMIGMAITLDRISDLLGQDHDLAELLRLVADRPDLCPNPLERSLMSALAQQRRYDLQTASRILGRRIYAERPDALESRFAAYWEAMEAARTMELTSISA
jgi:CHAD domain-containing protein